MDVCTCGTNSAHAVNCPVYYNRQKRRIAELEAELQALREALTTTRGQWIHSVNAKQCLAALEVDYE